MNIFDIKNVEQKTAALSEFKAPRASILLGQALSDVKHIERSISQFGLISPLIITKTRSGLVVVDGKKRLTAIKRMSFKGTLPQNLVDIPYISIEDTKALSCQTASILSQRDFYDAVTVLKSQGHSTDSIAGQLYLCRKTVTDFIRLSFLCLPLRQAFFEKIISFDQAEAFTVIPDPEAQISVFKDLGPSAGTSDILEAMEALRAAYEMKEYNKNSQNAPIADFALSTSDVVTIFPKTRQYVWSQAA